MRNLLTVPRGGVRLAVVVAALFVISGAMASLASAVDDSGPLVTVDRVVVERGATVTITLNRFPANQRVVVIVRAEGYQDQGAVIATLPVAVDANGGGMTTVPSTGLASGNYTITVANDDGTATPDGVGSAFGVIDPGTLGPRLVRTHPVTDIDG